MIKFEDYDRHAPRPDVVSVCDNCQCISASHFMKCPDCGHNKLTKKQIKFYEWDVREKQYPVKMLSKAVLVDNFVPDEVAEKLTDKQMLYIARYVEKRIDEIQGLILTAVEYTRAKIK